MSQQAIVAQQPQSPVQYTAQNDPVTALANRYGMLPAELDATLRKTVFRDARSNEEFLAMCFIAKEYQLNPLLKEIYAVPAKNGGVVPLVGVDGYISMMLRHPDFDGMEFRYSEETVAIGAIKDVPRWIEVVIHKKSCTRPTVVREYLDECFRPTEPWRTHPRRMLRHKAVCQGARMAFGFSGIYSEADEAEPVAVQASVQEEAPQSRQGHDVNAVIVDAVAHEEPAEPRKQNVRPAPKTARPAKGTQTAKTITAQVPLQTAPDQVEENIREDYSDYLLDASISRADADAVCARMVETGEARNMLDAMRLFFERKITV
ncbi:MAG: recombinase RecT [Desulfovibrio sp.]|nr:recombinase RecT [Desulfovibrio sp.]